MIWLAAALALIVAAALGIARAGRARRAAPVVPPELAARLTAATAALSDAAPWLPAVSSSAPVAAAGIEAALIARAPARALELAEAALAATPNPAPAARIWLAWALCANGQPRAALDQLAKAGDDDGALSAYVAARATHLLFEHGHGAQGATPPLVTTGDLAVVTLGRGRGGAAWLTGAPDGGGMSPAGGAAEGQRGSIETQLSAAEVRAALADHRAVTARCLAGALDALALAPGFADAAYLAARLAVKAGLVAPASALFALLAPRMLGRPDADAFERDRRDLADPSAAVAAAKQRPVVRGQRSRSLRVLP